MGVGGWVGVGGQQITTDHKKSQKDSPYENWSLLDMFQKMCKSIFKICSYIQKMTPNPINAFKITIYNTKHTNNTQIHFEKSKNSKNPTIFKKFTFFIVYQISIIHTVYILHILNILHIKFSKDTKYDILYILNILYILHCGVKMVASMSYVQWSRSQYF